LNPRLNFLLLLLCYFCCLLLNNQIILIDTQNSFSFVDEIPAHDAAAAQDNGEDNILVIEISQNVFQSIHPTMTTKKIIKNSFIMNFMEIFH